MSLTSSGSTYATPANVGNASNLVGVASSKPLVELSSDSTNGQSISNVQVAVGGTAEALVSDINGPITLGSKITASPVAGIGMNATGDTEVVGIAQADLSSIKTVTESFTGSEGTTITAKVGLLPISISVAYYSGASSQSSISAFIPPFLQNLANDIAGKAVSPYRVLVSIVALLLGFITIVTMLYSGVHSGVISLGRNPLAADALRRGMVDVLVTALGILVVTGVIVAAVIVA
jgi:hypothetical protein